MSTVYCPPPHNDGMKQRYHTIIKPDVNGSFVGWVEEIPGVNSPAQTREELLENLRDALEEALEMYRAEARAAASGAYEEVSISA